MEVDKKQVFISYSRYDYKDENKKVITGNAITEIKKVFDEANITYWIDEEGVYSGDQYVPIIAKAIKSCDVFLFVSSKASNSSEWTSSEIAAARMYNKKIIPFRLDDSPYNDSIILYIAHLDFLDYKKNSQLALTKMLESVREYLERIEMENRKIKEELESKRILKEKEQKKLISEIELQAEELENDERDAELKRRKLQQLVQNVESEEVRNRLLELIDSKGSIQRKYNDLLNSQKEKISDLEQKQQEMKEEKDCCTEEIESQKKEKLKYLAELEQTKKELKTFSGNRIATSKYSKLLIFILGASLICSLGVICLLLLFTKNEITEEDRMSIEADVYQKIKEDSLRIVEKNCSIMNSLYLRPVRHDLYGYKDEEGNLRIPYQWDYAYEFKDGIAKVKNNSKYGLIDKTGKEIVECKYYRIGDFKDGIAKVENNSKYGLIDKTGKEIVECKYYSIGDFKDGLARVCYKISSNTSENDSNTNDYYYIYGLIDKTGKDFVECKWRLLDDFYDDMAMIRNDRNKYGFIDKTGKVAISCRYDKAWKFEDGKAQVEENSTIFFINKVGEKVEVDSD